MTSWSRDIKVIQLKWKCRIVSQVFCPLKYFYKIHCGKVTDYNRTGNALQLVGSRKIIPEKLKNFEETYCVERSFLYVENKEKNNWIAIFFCSSINWKIINGFVEAAMVHAIVQFIFHQRLFLF